MEAKTPIDVSSPKQKPMQGPEALSRHVPIGAFIIIYTVLGVPYYGSSMFWEFLITVIVCFGSSLLRL